jgi:alpha-ketoglutarate-dependent taurine dioxygenase
MAAIDLIEGAILQGCGMFSVRQGDFDPEALLARLKDRSVPTRSEGATSIVEDIGRPTTDCSKHTLKFDWHTDGLYHDPPPRWTVLHCIDPGAGEITTEVADALAAIGRLSAEHARVLEKLETVYVGRDGKRHARRIVGPTFVHLASRGFVTSGASVEDFPSIRETVDAVQALIAALDGGDRHIQKWQTGDVLVFDNHRHLHRRVGIAPDPKRRLTRMWFK